MSVKENLTKVKSQIKESVTLVAVSKFHPTSAILEAYNEGQRIFGESRVQELQLKAKELPEDVRWHFIGHLQTNKVKAVVPLVEMIHAVDSERLLLEINSAAAKANKVVSCLLQIHIAKEETKYGFAFDECKRLVANIDLLQLTNVRIVGLMGMATLTEDDQQIRDEFRSLRVFMAELKSECMAHIDYFSELSIGMSDDFQLAIEEGSTMVRIGSTIFGTREY